MIVLDELPVAMISASAEQLPSNHSNQFEDLKYLDTVENSNGNMWELELQSGQDIIRFKVDTGIVSLDIWFLFG